MKRLVLITALVLLPVMSGCKACGSILDWLSGPEDDPKHWSTDPNQWNSGPAPH
jgi:hypothetical protein